MAKAARPPSAKPQEPTDYRAKPVQFGFIDPEKMPHPEPSDITPPELPEDNRTPEQREIDEVRRSAESDLIHAEYLRNGWLIEGRAPRDSTEELKAALAKVFDSGVARDAKVKVIEAALAPIYEKLRRDLPKRDAINRALGRRKPR